MRAVVFNEPGEPSVLHIENRDKPVPGDNEVLIKVAAAGVNRPDTFQRLGRYPAPKGIVQDIPGLEISGTIEKAGSKVTTWKEGQSVFALVAGGGYAEYVVADAGSCLPVPKGFSLEDAAALPEVLFTVWHNLFQRGGLKKGEDVLIYGGSGGIGAMAIQLTNLFGAHAYSMASSEGKMNYCLDLGAKKVVNYKEKKLPDELGTESMDLILDSLGGEYLDTNLDLLRPDGRLVYINAMEGGRPPFDIKKMMRKRLHITGSTLRARDYEFKKALAEDIYRNAFPLLEDKRFKNMVKSRFPLEMAADAHRLMESRDFVGKIILLNGE
ncbi:MAG: NAD(P)H-quinone oxidoreductase [Chitinophagaceae bacterium]|nr:NAD(P)H-quinone oxidoreductase [Chitinophagaceae bacterium]